jgi:hypothetical protein
MPIDPEFPKNHQVIGKHKHAAARAIQQSINQKKAILQHRHNNER